MINCFIPFLSLPQARQTVRALGLCDRIKNIYLLATEKIPDEVEGCEMLMIDSPASTATFRTIALHADTAYTLLYTKYTAFEPGQFAFERLLAIAGDTNAGMLYADRYLLKNGNSQQAPVIDYQKGSLRDDFDFGSLLFFRSSVLKQAVRAMDADYRFAGAETDGSGGCEDSKIAELAVQSLLQKVLCAGAGWWVISLPCFCRYIVCKVCLRYALEVRTSTYSYFVSNGFPTFNKQKK